MAKHSNKFQKNTKKENNPYLRPQISRISNVDVRTNEMIPKDDHKVVFDRGNKKSIKNLQLFAPSNFADSNNSSGIVL